VRIDFPYAAIEGVDIAERNLLGIFAPSVIQAARSEEEIIAAALARPVGAGRLAEVARGCTSALILVDDWTRSTPVRVILPLVIDELDAAGVPREGIRILVALGTHRPMTAEEMAIKLGAAIVGSFPVVNHNFADTANLVRLGETDAGTPVLVNRLAAEADVTVGIGQIVPHRVSGFSGGGNIVQPGICGEETTGKTHWLAAEFPGRAILGVVDNPVKREIEKVALAARLRWIVNTIQDGTGRVVDAVAGDPVSAYRTGAAVSKTVYRAAMPAEADIVLADSHPYDADLWVAAKGIYASELAVKAGGWVILVSPCASGVCPAHPEVLEQGYATFAEVEQRVRAGMIPKLTVAAHLVHVGRVIKERARGILVSPGITQAQTEKLGFTYGRTAREALAIALSASPADATIAVLQRGGEILPVVGYGNDGEEAR
jgi:nickel-dependent lactate racemase